MTLNDLINDYNSSHGIDFENRQKYLHSLSDNDLLKSLCNFGMVVIDGKSRTSSHFKNNRWFNRKQITHTGTEVQFRNALIEQIRLRKILSSNKITTFDFIFREIETIVEELRKTGIKGASQMTVYDVALHLGAKRKIYPDKIYIHRGVRNGAYALDIIETEDKDYILPESEVFEKAALLKKLKSAKHIENFLCIKKNEIKILSSIDRKK
jgi:hypothetical protein